ncbi:MAG: tyrosine-type recombinase/integrase [Victivallaceae bacterium]
MAVKSQKLERGTVFQKQEGGIYFYRYQLNGERKTISLKTKNFNDAVDKAKALLPLIQASSAEVIAAHVKHARGLAAMEKNLLLSEVWSIYEKSPERATPATVSEASAYHSTFQEFIDWVGSNKTVRNISSEIAEEYAQYLRKTRISVSTHNRKIKRIRRVFRTLREYCQGDNPFQAPTLLRKEREEREQDVHRLAFTREQEQRLQEVLDDTIHKVKNKPEVRVIYYLGMFTGQRLKDCVLLRWSKVDFERSRVWVKQFKTGKDVTIPLAPRLKEVLEEALKWKTGDSDYVCPLVAKRYNRENEAGKNVGNNLVNIDMLRVIRWIGLEPSVKVPGRNKKVTIYGFHSLRHSFASYCAAAGVPAAIVQSILGADSEIINKFYTHVGDEAQMKAIAAISGELGGKSAQQRIDEALTLIKNSPLPSNELLAAVKVILES